MNKFSCCILGLFHAYAHEYSCQILFSPRNILGVGWVDGEACERFWSAIGHFVATLRHSTAYSRRQTLTHASLYVADMRHRGLAANFETMFTNVFQNIGKLTREVGEYCRETFMNKDELLLEGDKMKKFFEGPTRLSVSEEDQICELIMALQSFEVLNAAHAPVSQSRRDRQISQQAIRLYVRISTGGRIDHQLDSDPAELRRSLELKLAKGNWDYGHWIDDHGEPTELFRHYMREYDLRHLKLMKFRIWQALVNRKGEFQQLYGSGHIGIPIQFRTDCRNQSGWSHSS